jgi:hypothetical protein
MSNRELAAWYSISEGAIRKRAKSENWVKKSTQPGPRTKPRTITIEETPVTPETTSPEAIVGRGRNLTLRLIDELEATTKNVGELETLIGAVIDSGSEAGKEAKEAIEQIASLKNRADVLKSLALAAKTLSDTLTAAPAGGKKAERQKSAEEVASRPGSKFAPPAAPKVSAPH